MVPAANHATTSAPQLSCIAAGPMTIVDSFSTVKTPALTTATACNRALTGVGATIALGNHW